MTRRTKTILGCIGLSLVLGLIVVLIISQPSGPDVEYTGQAAIRAAMKWPAWKIALDRLLSLVPPLRKALNPTLNINAALMEVRMSPELVASNLLSSLPANVTNSLRAWVLTPAQLAALKSGLKSSNYVGHTGIRASRRWKALAPRFPLANRRWSTATGATPASKSMFVQKPVVAIFTCSRTSS